MAYGQQLSSKAAVSSWAVGEAASRVLFILAAAVSFVLSVTLWFTGHHEQALFVGLWVPSILSLGGLMLARGVRR